MPLKTFYNLERKRQKEILDACFKEFALHEYKIASIGNIIKELNIAKGSFYRYFKDKKDLYFFLIEYASQMRLKHVDKIFPGPGKDLFEAIIENFSMKIQFDLEYPLYSGFLYNVMQEKNNEEIGNIQLETKRKITLMVIDILTKYQTVNNLRQDIPIFDLSYLIVQVQWGMYEYLELKYKVNYRENVKKNKPVMSIQREKILEDVRSFVQLIKNGITNQIHD